MVMKRILLAMCTVFLSSAALAQTGPALLMRNPTVSRTHFVFSYAGDLWIVSREGGEATRLTTGTGNESGATFSPDGQTIVFTGEYDGNVDVYTVAGDGRCSEASDFSSGFGWNWLDGHLTESECFFRRDAMRSPEDLDGSSRWPSTGPFQKRFHCQWVSKARIHLTASVSPTCRYRAALLPGRGIAAE